MFYYCVLKEKNIANFGDIKDYFCVQEEEDIEEDDSNSNQNNLLDCLVQAQSYACHQVGISLLSRFGGTVPYLRYRMQRMQVPVPH